MVSKQIQQLVVSPTQMALDHKMVAADLWGTTAHVLMLERSGILAQDSAVRILSALQDIKEAYRQDNFQIDPGLGAQLSLEKEIVERAGEQAGLAAHTARSRNDQVMVTELADSAVNLNLRCWTNSSDYWALKFELTHQIKERIEAAGCSIPFPQHVVHMTREA